MDWITIQTGWDEYKVAAKLQWDKLSEQQLHGTRGNREYLLRRVQEAYSLSREDAERQISEWLMKQAEKRALKESSSR
ncbi:MAG TPA: general stress protein CsbD [Burkholderiales bacterium]|nr:general stress protein CsbD [Burkholderiales bacterium]